MAHLVVATPMFGGQCTGAYTQSLLALQRAFLKNDHKLTTLFMGNESLIQRARNALTWIFLNKTDADHMLFCDADQGFRARDVALMLNAGKDIIAAPVPMKKINWQRIAKAVQDGAKPEELERYAGWFNVVHKIENRGTEQPITEPFEVERAGTGLMLISRKAFETIDQLPILPEWYYSDLPGDEIPPGSVLNNYFPVEIDRRTVPDHPILMSEDFGFCLLAKQAGLKIWCAPWFEITHSGAYAFSGCYGATFGRP